MVTLGGGAVSYERGTPVYYNAAVANPQTAFWNRSASINNPEVAIGLNLAPREVAGRS